MPAVIIASHVQVKMYSRDRSIGEVEGVLSIEYMLPIAAAIFKQFTYEDKMCECASLKVYFCSTSIQDAKRCTYLYLESALMHQLHVFPSLIT